MRSWHRRNSEWCIRELLIESKVVFESGDGTNLKIQVFSNDLLGSWHSR